MRDRQADRNAGKRAYSKDLRNHKDLRRFQVEQAGKAHKQARHTDRQEPVDNYFLESCRRPLTRGRRCAILNI